ncbi:MAG: hypothetical protein FWG04_02745 [Desulfovibrionaceae bacterium]|nr:hypothetical protein [Desulfovibrionaceae bacterium]
MNFKKYPEICGEKGTRWNGVQALADALNEGTAQLWQVAQSMPTVQEFLIVGWDVVLTFPRQPGILFRVGSFHDKKTAEACMTTVLEAQAEAKTRRKAEIAAKRARNKVYREEAREEIRKLSAMTPEEQGEYWAERARKHAEELRKFEEMRVSRRREPVEG